MNFKDTKYSGNNYISENTNYELQEVQERTIFEEENEQVSVAQQATTKKKKKTEGQHRNPSTDFDNQNSQLKSKQLMKKQSNLIKQNQIYGNGIPQASKKKPTNSVQRRPIEQRQQQIGVPEREMSEMREEKNGSTVSGKMAEMQMNSTATGGSGSATNGLGKSNGLRTASLKNKNLVGASKHKTTANESHYNEERSTSRDPYH